MRPIPACIHREQVGEYLWCSHPKVHATATNNFVNVNLAGELQPDACRCRGCPMAAKPDWENRRLSAAAYQARSIKTLDDNRPAYKFTIEPPPGQKKHIAVGDILASLIHQITGKVKLLNDGCAGRCSRTIQDMNRIGIEGCIKNRDVIIKRLTKSKRLMRKWDKLKAAIRVGLTHVKWGGDDLPFTIAGCFDEAIRLAKEIELAAQPV